MTTAIFPPRIAPHPIRMFLIHMPATRSAAALSILALFAALVCAAGCAPAQPVTQAQEPPPKPPIELLAAWGTPGDEPGQLSRPAGIATDAVGNVYIADAGSRFVHKFDAAGTPLFSFTDLLLYQPAAIAVDRGNAIYVLDARYDALFIFLPNGDRLRRLRGAGGTVFRGPTDVAVDAEGIVYTAEPGGKRIRAFNPRGVLRRVFRHEAHDNGSAASPTRLAEAPDGILYAAAPDGRVHVFPSRGASTWWELEPQLQPSLDAVAATDKAVFVAGEACREVQAWSHSGTLLHTVAIPAGAAAAGQPAGPCRLAATQNDLFVLDGARRRVLRFRLNF